MSQQSKRRSKNIIIWRDSVAAGDDFNPPHAKKIKAESDETIEKVLEKILDIYYLPSIIGGKATWIVEGKFPLAVIAQQWSKPYYLVDASTPIGNLVELVGDHQLKFIYWCQAEPNEVIASIKQGKPLPDRYGGDKKKETNIFERIGRLFFKSQ
jgi:hypothetical protein